jgi:hypothetical protein
LREAKFKQSGWGLQMFCYQQIAFSFAQNDATNAEGNKLGGYKKCDKMAKQKKRSRRDNSI